MIPIKSFRGYSRQSVKTISNCRFINDIFLSDRNLRNVESSVGIFRTFIKSVFIIDIAFRSKCEAIPLRRKSRSTAIRVKSPVVQSITQYPTSLSKWNAPIQVRPDLPLSIDSKLFCHEGVKSQNVFAPLTASLSINSIRKVVFGLLASGFLISAIFCRKQSNSRVVTNPILRYTLIAFLLFCSTSSRYCLMPASFRKGRE